MASTLPPAGQLDRRVTLRKAITSANALSEPVETWVDVVTVACARIELSGAERVRADEISAATQWRFMIRWARAWADLDPTWRLMFEGVEFNVEDVSEIGRRVGFDLRASARAERS